MIVAIFVPRPQAGNETEESMVVEKMVASVAKKDPPTVGSIWDCNSTEPAWLTSAMSWAVVVSHNPGTALSLSEGIDLLLDRQTDALASGHSGPGVILLEVVYPYLYRGFCPIHQQ